MAAARGLIIKWRYKSDEAFACHGRHNNTLKLVKAFAFTAIGAHEIQIGLILTVSIAVHLLWFGFFFFVFGVVITRITFLIVDISYDFGIGFMQIVYLLQKRRQQLVIVGLILGIELVVGRCWLVGFLVGIARETWITESEMKFDAINEGHLNEIGHLMGEPSIF